MRPWTCSVSRRPLKLRAHLALSLRWSSFDASCIGLPIIRTDYVRGFSTDFLTNDQDRARTWLLDSVFPPICQADTTRERWQWSCRFCQRWFRSSAPINWVSQMGVAPCFSTECPCGCRPSLKWCGTHEDPARAMPNPSRKGHSLQPGPRCRHQGSSVFKSWNLSQTVKGMKHSWECSWDRTRMVFVVGRLSDTKPWSWASWNWISLQGKVQVSVFWWRYRTGRLSLWSDWWSDMLRKVALSSYSLRSYHCLSNRSSKFVHGCIYHSKVNLAEQRSTLSSKVALCGCAFCSSRRLRNKFLLKAEHPCR